jgi:hypothetical protein
MTTKLNEMWAALEAHQPKADADGHGESWRVMREKRTWAAAWAAYWAAPEGSAAARAAVAAAWAAGVVWRPLDAAKADDYAQHAIDAIREVKP